LHSYGYGNRLDGTNGYLQFYVTVNDTDSPVITCPPDPTAVPEPVPPADFGHGSASDNCDPAPVVTHVGDVAVGTNPTVITRTYLATDANGNIATRDQTIRVRVVAVIDSDGDGVPDNADRCPNTPIGAAIDADGCSIEQLVPCEGPLTGGTWRNHGKYVSSVVKTAAEFVAARLITEEEAERIVEAAARSQCGKK
jgi:hypothetical protein